MNKMDEEQANTKRERQKKKQSYAQRAIIASQLDCEVRKRNRCEIQTRRITKSNEKSLTTCVHYVREIFSFARCCCRRRRSFHSLVFNHSFCSPFRVSRLIVGFLA